LGEPRDDIVGHINVQVTEKWPDVVSRFRVFLSIQEPELLKTKLDAWLEADLGSYFKGFIEKDTLSGVLDAFFDHKWNNCSSDDFDVEGWIFYPAEESSPPTGFGKMDYIFQVVDEYEKKEHGRKPKPWTHLAFHLSSRVKVQRHAIEATIRDWIDDATHNTKLGELGTWVMAKPVKTLPDETVKRTKIPITKAALERALKRKEKPVESMSGEAHEKLAEVKEDD
jgi:hypothetical protein